MATMNISLPDPMRNWVQDRVSEGQYASGSSSWQQTRLALLPARPDKLDFLEVAAVTSTPREYASSTAAMPAPPEAPSTRTTAPGSTVAT